MKRYGIATKEYQYGASMEPSEDGDWVDADEALARIAELEAEIIGAYVHALGYDPDDRSYLHASLHLNNAVSRWRCDARAAEAGERATESENERLRAKLARVDEIRADGLVRISMRVPASPRANLAVSVALEEVDTLLREALADQEVGT